MARVMEAGQKETALLWRSRAVSEGKDKKDRKDHEP